MGDRYNFTYFRKEAPTEPERSVARGIAEIGDTGIGRSIYYSKTNLVELAAMVYWLSVGLSFDIACETLKTLKDQEPELFSSGTGKRFMLLEAQERSLSLVAYDRKQAIASLDEGKPVIPVWLDVISQQLMNKLAG
ncbi:putative transcriptional regulator, MerR family protein [Tolypothrix sp. NIES-4075]|uniref:MerR family transcriptional regulator n=1 Tax=Tolypothrix sp. NIES-4075 TaxID=2005459 RepID=UPI000B630DD3|nr:MerR family transcriptional regulator [Tolypothrix sp. NIES-4075]GAX39283.1 putative transcriptional regulator, MerR family protein [Tolypothrix sp. NIES-4075]